MQIHEINTPQQENGYDCGVYCVLVAYYIVDSIISSFSNPKHLSPEMIVEEASNSMKLSLTPKAVTEFRQQCICDIDILSREYLLSKQTNK